MTQTTMKSNYNFLLTNNEYQKLLTKISTVDDFMEDFGELSWGRDFIEYQGKIISLQRIAISSELTLCNCIECCRYGCIADANILLRKYRDDLLFYLYLSVYKLEQQDKLPNEQRDDTISKWLQNELSNLYYGNVMDRIKSIPSLKDAIKKNNLDESMKKIANRLNNFTHGNGEHFYNMNVNIFNQKELQNNLKQLVDDTIYITTMFLFLLILCSPLSVMATDYTDYLDNGQSPLEGSQYFIAPYVEDFIKNNINMLDSNCLNYLINNTLMKFSNLPPQ